MPGRTEGVDAPRQQGARLRHTVEYGEEAQRSGSGCSGARMPRYLRDGALTQGALEELRRESREKVFQTLFMMDFLGVGPDEAIPLFALVSSPAPDEEYFQGTGRGGWEHREELDGLIRRAAERRRRAR